MLLSGAAYRPGVPAMSVRNWDPCRGCGRRVLIREGGKNAGVPATDLSVNSVEGSALVSNNYHAKLGDHERNRTRLRVSRRGLSSAGCEAASS